MVAASQVETYLHTLLRGDRRQALAVVDAAIASGLAIDEVQEDVIREAQRRIGALWGRGEIGVAEEHLATAITRQALTHLHQGVLPPMLKDERVLVACVAGERHDLPARLVAELLELDGYDVRFLGADVPPQSLASMIAQFRPDVLALSVTLPANLPSLVPMIRVALAHAPALLVAVGGHAINTSAQLPQVEHAEILTAIDARALAQALDLRFGYVPAFRGPSRDG